MNCKIPSEMSRSYVDRDENLITTTGVSRGATAATGDPPHKPWAGKLSKKKRKLKKN